MKRPLHALARVLVVGLIPFAGSIASATPMLYEFTGQVTGVQDDAGLIPADIYVGAPVSYVYLVDFDAPGTTTAPGGEPVETIYTHYFNSFYVDLISGDYLDAEHPNALSQIEENNYGRNILSSGYYRGSLVVGSSAASQILDSGYGLESNRVQNWVVGQYFLSEEVGHNQDATLQSSFTATVQLQSITVPEPAALILLVSGLVALGGYSRAASARD